MAAVSVAALAAVCLLQTYVSWSILASSSFVSHYVEPNRKENVILTNGRNLACNGNSNRQGLLLQRLHASFLPLVEMTTY